MLPTTPHFQAFSHNAQSYVPKQRRFFMTFFLDYFLKDKGIEKVIIYYFQFSIVTFSKFKIVEHESWRRGGDVLRSKA